MADPSVDLLQRVEQILKGITPGPWAWESIAEKSNEWAVGQAFDVDGKPIAGRIPEGEWIEDVVIERRLIGLNESGHANFKDAEFIAAAPALVRDLAEAVRALQDENARMKKELQER